MGNKASIHGFLKAVRDALKDNFKKRGWTDEDVFGRVNADGKTLAQDVRERVVKRRRGGDVT